MKREVHEEYRSFTDHWWFRGRREIFDRLLRDSIRLPADARILDVGPGSGVNLPVLGPRGRVTVLDNDVESLRTCRASGAEELVCGDASDPPLRDGAFDLVAALDVLEHLDDDRAALLHMHRVLRPGGALLLTVPALGVLWGRQDVMAEHRRRYRRGPLRRLLLEVGFRIEKLTYFNSLLLPPILAVRLAMRPFVRRSARGAGSDFSIRCPFGIDSVLCAVFASEAGWLTRRGFPIGTSLLAVARTAAAEEEVGR